MSKEQSRERKEMAQDKLQKWCKYSLLGKKAAAMRQQSSDPKTSDASTVESKAKEDTTSIDERVGNGQEHNQNK